MRTTKNILAGLIASLAISGLTLMAGTTPPPRSIEDRVRREILSVPFITVFDNLSYSVKDGVVTLSGQVVLPIDKDNMEDAVKRVQGVTRVDNQIEVLPVSPFDDRIRFATLRALLRSAPLGRYFLGANPSIRIVVKNGNVALDGVVLNAGDRQVASMAANGVSGVFSVTNNLRTEK
jgi:hyperosmotically inducible protein